MGILQLCNYKVMNFVVFLVLIWKAEEGRSETPYHYISQVAPATSQTVSPKPLFSPHDTRREGNGRKETYIQEVPGGVYNYGTKVGDNGRSAGHNLVYTDAATNVHGDGQTYWYPLYSDVQYPTLVDYGQSPYILSYGALPPGYEPSVPSGGDPLGYSYSYQAGDHSRHEVSDGKGNFYSSFSFIPPSDSIGQLPKNIPLSPDLNAFSSRAPPSLNIPINPDLNVFSSRAPPTVNIPARRPTYTTEQPHPSRIPSSSKPLFIPSRSSNPYDSPTAKPLVGSEVDPNYNDFANGYYFESKKLHPTRIPQKPYTAGSHALSTNIQYDNVARESSSKSSTVPSGSRSVTIEPNGITPSSTDRSYHTLSRSLPMAFVSQKISTVPTPFSSSEKPFLSQISRRKSKDSSVTEVLALRSASRRSTTEKYPSQNNDEQFATVTPISSTKKPSVIQKIPRKLKSQNATVEPDESSLRPSYIHDLTSFAYSADKSSRINNTIVQFKSASNKVLSDNEIIDNSNKTSEVISKDGYIRGNKTYLGGLGLTANIHY